MYGELVSVRKIDHIRYKSKKADGWLNNMAIFLQELGINSSVTTRVKK